MKFLQSNGKLIVKTIGFQVVISLLGMMLGTATGAYNALRLLGAACAVLCYFYIIGSQFWNKGSVDALTLSPKGLPLTGLWAAILAFLPSMVCVLLCAFSPMADAAGNQTWVFALFAVTKLVFMGVYFGFALVLYPIGADFSVSQILTASQSQSAFLALCLIPGILICALCYILGRKNINPFGMFTDESKRK